MSRILRVYIDDATEKRLLQAASEHHDGPARGDAEQERRMEALAEAAVETAALDYFRGRSVDEDPAHK